MEKIKATGVVRKLDKLGRIVLPKELRDSMNIQADDHMEIFMEDDGSIILRKYAPFCAACGSMEEVETFGETRLCKACVKLIKHNNL